MPDDTDSFDGARDLARDLTRDLEEALTRDLVEALRETAVLEGVEGPAGVAVFPVEEPQSSGEPSDGLEALDARLAEHNRHLGAIAEGIERQEALLADLTARVGDLEARLEEVAAGED